MPRPGRRRCGTSATTSPSRRSARRSARAGTCSWPSCCRRRKSGGGGRRSRNTASSCSSANISRGVKPFPKVRELLERIRADGKRIALASSAKKEELEARQADRRDRGPARCRDVLGRRREIQAPPGYLRGRPRSPGGGHGRRAIAVGDTPYDAQAAGKAGLDDRAALRRLARAGTPPGGLPGDLPRPGRPPRPLRSVPAGGLTGTPGRSGPGPVRSGFSAVRIASPLSSARPRSRRTSPWARNGGGPPARDVGRRRRAGGGVGVLFRRGRDDHRVLARVLEGGEEVGLVAGPDSQPGDRLGGEDRQSGRRAGQRRAVAEDVGDDASGAMSRPSDRSTAHETARRVGHDPGVGPRLDVTQRRLLRHDATPHDGDRPAALPDAAKLRPRHHPGREHRQQDHAEPQPRPPDPGLEQDWIKIATFTESTMT